LNEVELLDVLLVAELFAESSRLVSASYADCALVTLPALIALKRLSISCPRALIPELPELSPLVDAAPDAELPAAVLGVA